MSVSDVDRILHYVGPEVLDSMPPAPSRPVVDRDFYPSGTPYKAPDASLPVSDDLVSATPYDPWHKAAEIRAGVAFQIFASPPFTPAPNVWDVDALRAELEGAQAVRADASAEVDRYRSARARSAAQLDALVAEVEAAQAERQAQDLDEVDRLREAALAGDGIALPALGPAPVSEAERGLPVLQALVARLDGEVADHEKVLGASEDAVARIVSKLMEAEAEDLAADLWAAKGRVAALQARLDGFTRITPPHMNQDAKPARRVDLGGGNFLMEPDYSVLIPSRFDPSPAVAKALHRTPGLDAAGFSTGGGNFLTEGDAWSRYAAALRSDSHALPIPVTEPHEALK